MNAYTRAGNVEGAERVLSRMLEDDEARPNVHTYTTLMNVYVKANMPQGAEKVRGLQLSQLMVRTLAYAVALPRNRHVR